MAPHPRSVVSFFSGIGALDLAIGRVFPDARTLCYVENEATSVLRLAANMAAGRIHAAPVWSDVRTFPGAELRGRADMVVGGFPCQDISNAGKGAGLEGARSGLFFDLMAAVRDVRPRYLFLENVAALTVRGLDTVLGTLAEVGFDARWGCLRASDVGAPHGRDRWWCLAWDREQLAYPQSERDRPGHIGGRKLAGGGNGAAEDEEWTGSAKRRDVRHDTDDSRNGNQLADAIGGRHDGRALEPWRGPLGGTAAAGHGAAGDAAVGDADTERLEGRCLRGHERPNERSAARAERSLEHAAGIGRGEGRPESVVRGRRDAASDAGRLPQWPPSPADSGAWQAVLERWPHLAPAVESRVRGMAHGNQTGMDLCMCHRGDRLRGLGNAVVPACAESALRILWLEAFGELP